MMGEEISQELAQRMATFCRGYVERTKDQGPKWFGGLTEVRAIVAELPKPVDPDLIEAREWFIGRGGGIDADKDIVDEVRQGAADHSDEIQIFLGGLKRGRELSSLSHGER